LAPPPAATRCVKSHRGESEPRREGFARTCGYASTGGGVFLKLINLTTVICILILIADIARTKAAWHGLAAREKTAKMAVPATLLNATARTCAARTEKAGTSVTKPEFPSQHPLNKSGIKAESKPHRPENTTNEQPDNSEGNAKPPRFLAKARAGGEWECIRMRVTAYCPCPKCCGEYSDGVTACGHKIRPGDTFVAADRRYLFGTEMLIPGYSNDQTVKVLDRGGAIKGNRLDVFFGSHEEALEWGVRYLEVRISRK